MISRYATAIGAGTLVTLTLFFVMQALIALQPASAGTDRVRSTLALVSVRDDTDVQRREDPVEFDDLKQTIEPPPRPSVDNADPTMITVSQTPAPKPGPGKTGILKSTFADGPLVAILRIEPDYPTSAAQRGLEGWVLVQFDVSADGSVANVAVVQSSHPVFERPAKRAAARFRYKARVVDGIPIATPGVQNLFRFQLD